MNRFISQRRMALAVVLLGALAGFLGVAASGAFAQATTTDVTTSAVSNYNQAYALTTNNKLLCFDRDGIASLARTLFPYAAVLSFILPSSKSTGLL